MTAEVIQAAFEKYGSDKATHGYAEFYAKYLPDNPQRILEIGVKNGASIRAWMELFPNAKVWGVDLFEEFEIPDIPGAHFLKGNQCDWRILEALRDVHFDVIIDDGSHNARDQMMTLYGLITNNCHYFIEDTHCNLDEYYSQGLPQQFRAWFMYETFTSVESTIKFGGGGESCINYIKC